MSHSHPSKLSDTHALGPCCGANISDRSSNILDWMSHDKILKALQVLQLAETLTS